MDKGHSSSEDAWPVYKLCPFDYHGKNKKILKPYNLITPIGTIGNHLSPLPGISFRSNLPALAEDKGMLHSPL